MLEIYEACSGQMINKDKSSIMFSPNVHQSVRDEVKQVLELSSEANNERYLGLPVHLGHSKTQTF